MGLLGLTLRALPADAANPPQTILISLRSDVELYEWMDDIYARSPLMGVSNPTNFVHQGGLQRGRTPGAGLIEGAPLQSTSDSMPCPELSPCVGLLSLLPRPI